MSELRFVKATKYPNKCATCGNTIPKGAPAFWNGEKDKALSKNYHENCKPNAGSTNNRTEAGAGTPNSFTPPKGETKEPALHFDIQASMDAADKMVALQYGEGVSDTDAGLGLVQEVMRENFEIWLLETKFKLWGKVVQ